MSSVEAYIAAQPPASQPLLRAVRQAIRKGMPKAEESIAYQIPAYALGGRRVLYFAGWKKHLALYPTSTAMLAAMGDELEPYRAAKDSLHFSLARPVPTELIEKIAAFRATEDY